MPRTVAPNGCEKPVIAVIIFLGKDVFSGLGHFSLDILEKINRFFIH